MTEKIEKIVENIEIYMREANIRFNFKELQLTEEASSSGISYYSIRQFITQLHKVTKDSVLKKMLLELLKSLAILEVKRIPIPAIPKLKKISPLLFP